MFERTLIRGYLLLATVNLLQLHIVGEKTAQKRTEEKVQILTIIHRSEEKEEFHYENEVVCSNLKQIL